MGVSKIVDAIVIASSTGGPKALYEVITNLPKEIGVPILIVQHMPAKMTTIFAERLNSNSKIKVIEAYENAIIENNVVYIAPGGYHMEIGNDIRIHLNEEPSIWGVRPAADKLFFSATNIYENKLLGIVLTGMGRDGANGIAEIKAKGGLTISEDESTCIIYGMPKAAYETGKVDKVLPLTSIAKEITEIVNGRWVR